MSAEKKLFRFYKDDEIYGPFNLPSETCCFLFDVQRKGLENVYQVSAMITSHMPVGNLGRVTVYEALPVCFG